MSAAPGNTGVASLRAAKPSDTDAIQAVWDSSSSHDDPARSVYAWATATRVMVLDGSAYFNRPGPRLVDSLEVLVDSLVKN